MANKQFNSVDGYSVGSSPISVIDNNGNVAGNVITATANITSPRFISNVSTGTAPFVVTSTTQVANLNVATAGTAGSATTAGTVTTAAQPNITSVGTLTSLGVNGTVTAVAFTANTGVFTGNGSGLSAIAGANVTGTVANATFATSAGSATTAGTVTTAAQPNITSVGTLTSLTVSGNASAGNLNTAGAVVARTLTSNVATGTAPLTVTSTTRVANLNVAYANVTDFISASAGTGNNFLLFANAATGNVSEVTSTGLIANLSNNSITATTFVGSLSGAATSATTAGTVTTAAQPNITSVGTLTGLTANGNVSINQNAAEILTIAARQPPTTDMVTITNTGQNVATAGINGLSVNYVGGAAAVEASAIRADMIPGSTTGGTWNAFRVAPGAAAPTGVTFNGVKFDNKSTGAGTSRAFYIGTGYDEIMNYNGTVVINGNGTVVGGQVVGTVPSATSATTAGTVTTAAQPNITSVGTLTSLGVNGTVTAVAFTANTGVFTGNGSGLSAIAGANVTGTVSSATSATTAGTVTTAAQPNITSVGTLTGLGVNGTVTAVNFTANTGVFAGSGANLTTLNASNISSGTLAQARLANASVTLGSTALTLGSTVTTVAGLSSVTSTTFVGSLTGTATSATTAGTVTTAAQPNITSVGTLSSLSVTGNVAAGNLTTTGVLSVTGTGQSSIAGNLDMTSNNIVNLATPVNANDAATKQYVDDLAQGLHTHDSCNAATQTTLATISGGTVTYNNGSSGVGATLTTTGSYTTIDGVTLSNGMRILVKNEANAAHNGIYDRTSTTVLTRSSDFDTPTEMAGGDFVFVTAGTLYDSTGWVMTDAVTTVGTSAVNWSQFSGAGTYNAGTGLTLTGTTFSVNASQTQITSVGTLTGLNSSGTITAPAFTANTGVFTGNGSGLTALNASNISSGTLAQARLANASVTLGSTALTLGSTVTTVAGLSSVTSTTFVGSLTGAATTAGTVTTAAQPNITSVGTLTSLGVNGTITGVNITANTGVFTGNGSGLSALNGSNITTGTIAAARVATLNQNTTGYAATVSTAAQPNITSVGTLTGLTANGNVRFNMAAANTVAIAATAAQTSDMVTIVGNTSTAGVNALYVGFTGLSAAVEASAMRIDLTPGGTSGGTWSGLRLTQGAATASGVTVNVIKADNITTGAGSDHILYAGTGYDSIINYNGTTVINGTGQVIGSQVTGTVANATYATSAGSAGTATSATTAGTVTTAAQPNITSVGTLTSLNVSGNANVGNIGATNFVGSGASLTSLNASNLSSGTIPDARITGSYTGFVNLTGSGTVDFATFAGNASDTAALPSYTWTGDTNTGMYAPAADQVGFATGGVNRLTISNTAVTSAVALSVTGTATATTFSGSGASLTSLNGSNITTGTIAAARVATLNQNTTGYAATVSTAAQPNITSVGTLTSLTVSGNANFDSGTLFVDSVNNEVGIGTTSPLANIDIRGNARIQSNIAYVSPNGANTITESMLNGGTLSWSGNAGQLFSITDSMTGNIFTVNDVSGIPMISVDAGGNIQFAASGGFVSYGVTTGISAAGSSQGTATILTRPINVVSTVSSNQGVILPTVPAGARIIVMNTSGTALNVYPPSGAAVNSGATNAAYAMPAGTRLEFISVSSTQWYTMNATYG